MIQEERQYTLSDGFLELEAVLPARWKERSQGRSVLMVCYEVQGLAASEFDRPAVCDMRDVALVFVKGRVSHRQKVEVTQFWIDEDRRFNVVHPEPTKIVETPDGIYALFLSPYDVIPPSNTGELEARERISVAQGLVASFQGRNIVYRRIFENSYSLESKRVSAWSTPIPVPLSFPKPLLTVEGVGPIFAADKAIEDSPPSDRGRVRLSLRWLKEAMYDIGPIAFLKYWMAIETLTMPDTTNIKSLNETLARAYGLASASEAQDLLLTGLLFGLRGDIVHKGFIGAIDGRLLVYCECLYHDALREALGLPGEQRAGGRLGHDFDLKAYVKSLL
jgi:hypothetical protein